MAKSPGKSEELTPIGLSELLEPELIRLELKAADRWDALEALVDVAVKEKRIPKQDRAAILTALFAREDRRSSGIKNGVAVPCAPIDRSLTSQGVVRARMLLVVGCFKKGVDYEARDREPVRLLFLFLMPRGKLERFAPALPELGRLFESGTLTGKLLAVATPDAFIEIIEQVEGWQFAMDASSSFIHPQ